jgi:phosphoenolpyruvate carboxykinase (GTP)
MLPFCGYNMADYFAHWLEIGDRSTAERLPRIFYVNWFRRDENGRFLWPGYGENSRVLAWVFDRCNGTADAVDSPIGRLPTPDALNTDGLAIDSTTLEELLVGDAGAWRKEVPLIEEHFALFGDRLPDELRGQLSTLENRLG